MRASAVSSAVACILALAVSSVSAQDMLGHNDATVLTPDPASSCSVGAEHGHDDGSIENGYSWHLAGIAPPYYGAFGEAYDLGRGNVACGSYWLTQIGYYSGRPMDLYVWDGGVTREPEGVICMVPGVYPTNVPYWTECGRNDFNIECDVPGEFTLGYWVDFSAGQHEFYICSDEDGPGGHPWTCIAPGIGYPTGWNHVNVIFPGCQSLFIRAFFNLHEPSSVDEYPPDLPGDGARTDSPTWGRIKAIFGE